MGMDVVPTCKPMMNSDTPGRKNPIAIPAPIARKIHRVKKRSRNDNLFTIPCDIYPSFLSAAPLVTI
jgi:hypothetical protein